MINGPYSALLGGMGPAIPHSSARPIVKAEQLQPESRAARRQAQREANRKNPIWYAGEDKPIAGKKKERRVFMYPIKTYKGIGEDKLKAYLKAKYGVDTEVIEVNKKNAVFAEILPEVVEEAAVNDGAV